MVDMCGCLPYGLCDVTKRDEEKDGRCVQLSLQKKRKAAHMSASLRLRLSLSSLVRRHATQLPRVRSSDAVLASRLSAFSPSPSLSLLRFVCRQLFAPLSVSPARPSSLSTLAVNETRFPCATLDLLTRLMPTVSAFGLSLASLHQQQAIQLLPHPLTPLPLPFAYYPIYLISRSSPTSR
jgi:hypothetical protein